MKVACAVALALSIAGCGGGDDYKAAFEAYDKEVAEQLRLEKELAAVQAKMLDEIAAAREGAAAQAKSLDQLSELSSGLQESLGQLPEVDAADQAEAEAKANAQVETLTKQANARLEAMAAKEEREIRRSYKPEIDQLTRELDEQYKRVQRAEKRKDAAQP